ncbi:MAG: hypothetical protein COA45_02150 [Zetaproteobacteria bacterium]|nr:MAG: hypothetical protein COA45_02150 [Zetaproteobacteria bacterium]
MDDRELNKILKARDVPPMRSNLEHRILQASLESVEKTDNSRINPVLAIFSAILDSVILPKPALSMVFVLLFGLVLGAYPVDTLDVNAAIDVDAYFLAVETIEYGDVL